MQENLEDIYQDARTSVANLVANILVADDDEAFREILERRLVRMGHTVSGVGDGTEAIKRLREEEFDLLILDLNMPGEHGLEVIRTIQQNSPDLQTIVITGFGSIESAVEALRYRVFDYLTKPLESLVVFEIAVNRALNLVFQKRENASLMRRIQYLAETDPLTGLYNRHKMYVVLDYEVERAKNFDHPLTLIMMDLDGLKETNDTLGHPIGDEIISTVGRVVRNMKRSVDYAFRFGGDEFLMLLPMTKAAEGEVIAERIFEQLSKKEVGGQKISISMGIVEWDNIFKSEKEMIQAVDQALYESKRNQNQKITLKRQNESS